MTVLDFILIPSYEKDAFQCRFQSYLEEIDLLVGEPVDPNFQHRYPDYNRYFCEDLNKQPFRIFAAKENVGFFFLSLVNPLSFPKEIPIILSPNRKVASLTDFYLFPEYRNKGLAWAFYEAIIRLARDYDWDVCWECDVRNIPAVNFFEKLLDRIKAEFPFEYRKDTYIKGENYNREFYFYQVKFK
jgi:GNAT superfamily N-acetyltransferase